MTAPNREQFANDGITTLNGGIDASVTSIDVTDGNVFPASGNYRIKIDTEILLVTARSTNSLTVTRGAESTTAASHSNGAEVQLVLTADSIKQAFRDNIPLWGYMPALGKIVADDGVTALAASDFTWVNQDSSTVSDVTGGILLTCDTTAGNDVRLLTRTAPSTPYTYIAGFQAVMPRGGTNDADQICLGFRESSTGEFQLLQVGTSGDGMPNTLVQNWNSPTSFNANLRAVQSLVLLSPVWWLRATDNGTNLVFDVSADGANWIQINSAGRTAFMGGGPDQIFWGGRNDNNAENTAMIKLVHWSRE